jgi:hypothetical protein
MKTYPLQNERGELYAFEIPNSSFLSSHGVSRYFSRCPGVSISRVRRLFARNDEIHVEFEFSGEAFQVWEPYGDNSRYWVGPTTDPQRRRSCIDQLEAFVRESWPGPISKARNKLISLFTGRLNG